MYADRLQTTLTPSSAASRAGSFPDVAGSHPLAECREVGGQRCPMLQHRQAVTGVGKDAQHVTADEAGGTGYQDKAGRLGIDACHSRVPSPRRNPSWRNWSMLLLDTTSSCQYRRMVTSLTEYVGSTPLSR